jgi:hypothetical protein
MLRNVGKLLALLGTLVILWESLLGKPGLFTVGIAMVGVYAAVLDWQRHAARVKKALADRRETP